MKPVRTFAVVLAFLSTGCLGDEPETASTGGAGGGGGVAGSASGGVGGTCALPDGGACEAFHQCGCAGGQNCLFMGDGTTLCKAVGGTPAYRACAAFDACQKGMMCVSGVCKPFCEKASDCAGPSRICEQVLDQSNQPIEGALVCTAGCDLMAPAKSCGPLVTCMPLAKGAQGTDCVPTTGTGDGPGECANVYDCMPSYTCVATNCEKWCRVGYADCDAKTCVGGLGIYVNGSEYGTCV